MATMHDLAKRTNLSLGTVSKFINGGKVKEKNRVLLEQAIKECNYEINEVARSLKTKCTRSIGILLPSLNIHNTSIVDSLLRICANHNYSVVISCSNSENGQEYVDFLLKKSVDGIFFFPSEKGIPDLSKVKERKIPLIVVDYYFADDYCDFVIVNNRSASCWGMEQLLKAGHRNIVVLTGPEGHYTAEQRLKGCFMACDFYGIEFDKSLIVSTDYSVADAHLKLDAFLQKRKDITAIFATNYFLAQASYLVLRERGLKVPEDISIVMYDNLDFAKIVTPKPYIIDQPIEKIGETACEIMFERLSGSNMEPQIRVCETRNEKGESIRSMF